MNLKCLPLPKYVQWEQDKRRGEPEGTHKEHYCTKQSVGVIYPAESTLPDGWYLYSSKSFFRYAGNTYVDSHSCTEDSEQFVWTLEQLNHKYLSERDAASILVLTLDGATINKKLKKELTALYEADQKIKRHNFELLVMRQKAKKHLKDFKVRVAQKKLELQTTKDNAQTGT